ncbi:MAG: DUF1501 domain-containing protein [Myxococcota bacterium]
MLPRGARAAWGSAPTDAAAAALLQSGVRAESVLEVFMYGGFAPFESFYAVEEYGRPNDPDYPNQQWHLFASDHNRIYAGDCGITDSATWLTPFATDAAGMTVNLGPVATPFKQRADLLSRLRVVVTRHDLEPHEAAIPYMLSGMRLGNVRMAGMGTHVQRYFLDQGSAGRITPYSYVLTPNTDINTDNLRAASSAGSHPGAARPLSLEINSANNLAQILSRSHLTPQTRPSVDALLAHYRDASVLRHSDKEGVRLRSRAVEDHEYSLTSVTNAPELAEVLGVDLLEPEGGAQCDDTTSLDHTKVGIRAAASLLNNPIDPARYVNVIDGGSLFVADGGGGFDTHFEHPYTQAVNGSAMLQSLVDRINAPGEGDPAKIDLDKTMIVITTEFGRTPYIQFGNGTNHHPYGFVTLLLGGPVGPDQAGVLGAIGPDGSATDYVTPAELRAACLAAMGIYPFTSESFAVGDIRDATSELSALTWLNQHVLGRT